VQILSENLGHLDREAVPIEIVLVTVLGEPFASGLGGAAVHRHDLEQRLDLGF
jgi:hypothetical protein